MADCSSRRLYEYEYGYDCNFTTMNTTITLRLWLRLRPYDSMTEPEKAWYWFTTWTCATFGSMAHSRSVIGELGKDVNLFTSCFRPVQSIEKRQQHSQYSMLLLSTFTVYMLLLSSVSSCVYFSVHRLVFSHLNFSNHWIQAYTPNKYSVR